jgi:pyruvate dehydrogenase E2 component (dihydrolipoamide acetyltransferase)
MADIQMPQLGETVTEGTITKWFKQVGDEVAEDEPLFEVSTDKVDSEVPSPVSGTLTEILVPEGDTVDVGAVLARVGDAGAAPAEAAAEPAQAPAEIAEASAPAEGPAEPAEDSAPAEPTEASDAAEAPAEPAEASDAAEAPAEPAEAPGAAEAPAEPAEAPGAAEAPAEPAEAPSAPAAAPTAPAADAQAAPAAEAPAPGAPGSNGGRLLSPVVRRLITENNLDPGAISGTGPGGRITRNDVLDVLDQGAAAAPAAAPAAPAAPAEAPAAPAAPAPAAQAQPAPAAAPAPPAAAPAPQPVARAGERDTTVPFTNIRRRTAEHMTRSKATSAHVYASIEVDFEKVEQVRSAQKGAFKGAEGFSLTYLPFISRAVVDAIREYPEVNSTLGENELVVHNYVNLGIAVDLDFKGLMVPVIHDADGKRLRAIAREVSDLARRARSKQLSPDDIGGGTFTITNPGPFGTTLTLPIINQPQVAIVSTDGVKRRPVVVDLPDGSEGIAIHSTGNITLTWDHRAFDGAYAAAFLREIKDILETRDWAAELA